MSSTTKEIPRESARRNAVPIIYTRGTHYEIGFDIGTTFASVIQNFVGKYNPLNKSYQPLYETEDGRRIYDETLACVKQQYPQYVREIEGTADGSGVPFYKLFLMHLDDLMLSRTESNEALRNTEPVGCTSIICNHPGQEILGHNEDALSETLNHWYLVDAHVVEPGLPEEKYTSLCYAGFIPGYTMGYNHHGLVYSINTLSAKTLRSGKTPRYFITRALLGAESYEQAERTLYNKGCGAAEGFSVNMTFLKQRGDRVFYNAEIGPVEQDCDESRCHVETAKRGESLVHCNMYRRLKVAEVVGEMIDSSVHRHKAVDKHPTPKSKREVIEILSDQTGNDFKVYQDTNPDDHVKTLATGIFDCVEKTWTIYSDKPNCNEPIVVLPLRFKDDVKTHQKCFLA